MSGRNFLIPLLPARIIPLVLLRYAYPMIDTGCNPLHNCVDIDPVTQAVRDQLSRSALSGGVSVYQDIVQSTYRHSPRDMGI